MTMVNHSIHLRRSCSVLGSGGIDSNDDEVEVRARFEDDERCKKGHLAKFHSSVQIANSIDDTNVIQRQV